MFKSRTLALILTLLFVVLVIAPDAEAKKRNRSHRGAVSTATGVKDPRYADIIMNPVTGEVYRSQAADERRYPASLTKMMTLYMLFEALEKKKISMNDRMDVSELAARQPQTNLALSAGDTIPVETAIKALVVRSANDVAVVVGEALGGDVDRFAQMMTAKARALGMKNTVFKNPNGLPNNAQYTTARDMAKLGIALKRDFPRYYPYFSTLQFSHEGVTYYTHNRVMLRYAGVDGIKTGFIGLSGFNLVTSVTRGGRPLVGVVMGGSTGAWRDNRMIQLLDDTYKVIASRGAARGKMYPANLPLAKNGQKNAGVDASLITNDDGAPINAETMADNSVAAEVEDGGDPNALPSATLAANTVRDPVVHELSEPTPVTPPASPFAAAEREMAKAAPVVAAAVAPKPFGKPTVKPEPEPVKQTASGSKIVRLPAATVAEPVTAPAPTPATVAPVVTAVVPMGTSADSGWGIQVGAFSSEELARQAVKSAVQLAGKPLADAQTAIVGPGASGAAVHRARLEHLTQLNARKACEVLISNNSPCFIYKVAP